jgi:hypothetical protein
MCVDVDTGNNALRESCVEHGVKMQQRVHCDAAHLSRVEANRQISNADDLVRSDRRLIACARTRVELRALSRSCVSPGETESLIARNVPRNRPNTRPITSLSRQNTYPLRYSTFATQ